jgi:tRNA(adenine34) deaminase
MCAGGVGLARVDRLGSGTLNPKGGACVSLYRLPQDERLNHRVEIDAGVMRGECEALMKSFFEKLRIEKRRKATSGNTLHTVQRGFFSSD